MNKQKINKFLKKRTVKFSFILIIAIFTIFVAYSFGYIPIGLSVKPPIGNIEEIQIDQYKEKYQELSDIPNLDKIVYEVFGTDESMDSVLSNYEKELRDDGYSLKYKGSGYATAKNFKYVGYQKGLIAVGIIISDEAYEDINYETVVLYMTANCFDFIPLLEWYQEEYDSGAFY